MPSYRYLGDLHEYWVDFEDGHTEQYISATQLLDYHGLISEYGKNKEAALRGNMVHLASRYRFENRLDWASIDERILGYVQSLDLWVKATGFVAEDCEVRIWNDHLKLAGTYDVKGCMPDGGKFLIDLKSGVKEEWHRYQVALYLILEGGYRRRGCLYLKEDGDMAEFVSHDDPMDMVNAISLLNVLRIHEKLSR